MNMQLKGKKIAILIEQSYQVLEVWYPYYRFIEEGAEVHLVGPRKGETYPSKLGYPAVATHAAHEVRAADYAALVIPGGFSPDFMRRTQAMIDIAQHAADAGILLAAICHGPWLLCSTTALRGKKATCFMAIRHDVINAGATYVDAPCVVDGNLITSRKPEDLPQFCRAVIDKLA
jgi:protease I